MSILVLPQKMCNVLSLSVVWGLLGSAGVNTHIVAAEESVIIFRSTDDVRAEIARLETDERFKPQNVIDAKPMDGRPTLGVRLDENPLGPEVEEVIPGSAADLAGIEVGDHLVSIDNGDVDTIEDAAKLVENHPLGKTMLVKYQRNNYVYERKVRFRAAIDDRNHSDVAIHHHDEELVEDLKEELSAVRRQNAVLRGAVQFLLSDPERRSAVKSIDEL